MPERTISTNGGQAARPAEAPSVRAFAKRHKGLSVGALVLIIVLVTVVLPAIIGSGSTLNDSSPCATWSSANREERAAYARLYVKEHGSLPSGATAPASVESAITAGCTAAYAYEDADTVTVVQAIDGPV